MSDTAATSREYDRKHYRGVFHFDFEQAETRRSAAELMRQIPQDDQRSLTGRLLGDPLPNDPRRPWRAG